MLKNAQKEKSPDSLNEVLERYNRGERHPRPFNKNNIKYYQQMQNYINQQVAWDPVMSQGSYQQLDVVTPSSVSLTPMLQKGLTTTLSSPPELSSQSYLPPYYNPINTLPTPSVMATPVKRNSPELGQKTVTPVGVPPVLESTEPVTPVESQYVTEKSRYRSPQPEEWFQRRQRDPKEAREMGLHTNLLQIRNAFMKHLNFDADDMSSTPKMNLAPSTPSDTAFQLKSQYQRLYQ